ncbi:MAG: glycosyltransferase [Prevotella sp.]|nr:glycosyltransferase [Prevotella sp.]
MPSQNVKISVIIPVFNKERTVRRAVESVLRQGLLPTEYELLLIDDGSTDTSIDICRQLAAENPETIRFFAKKNEGVGPTRNYGINQSKGDYFCFLDSDDYLKDGGFRDLMDCFFDSRFDVLSYYSTTVREGYEDVGISKSIHGDIRFEATGHELLKRGFCPTFTCMSWYRKSFILENGLIFEPISYAEDVLFNINLLYANPRIRQTSSFIYQYVTYDEGNQLSKTRDKEKTTQNVLNFMKIYKRMGEISQMMKEHGKPCDMESIFENQLGTFTSRLLSSEITVKQLHRIKKDIQDTNLNNRPSKSKTLTISRAIIRSGYAFPVLKFIYQKFFVRFILPKIDRETGSWF